MQLGKIVLEVPASGVCHVEIVGHRAWGLVLINVISFATSLLEGRVLQSETSRLYSPAYVADFLL